MTPLHSTSTEAQRERLLEALRRGPVTTIRARRELDVMHPGGRVMELRRAGYLIATAWTTEPTECGRSHRVASYHLFTDVAQHVAADRQSARMEDVE